jgi:muramoyltetrapeptide carboxypeptidase LdcA involved in peptidoglycan recycling
MLNHLKLAGEFDHAGGAAFGRFIDCRPETGKPSLSLDQIIRNIFPKYRYPVISGFNYGHLRGSVSFAQGIRVRLDHRTMKLRFLEGGVR